MCSWLVNVAKEGLGLDGRDEDLVGISWEEADFRQHALSICDLRNNLVEWLKINHSPQIFLSDDEPFYHTAPQWMTDRRDELQREKERERLTDLEQKELGELKEEIENLQNLLVLGKYISNENKITIYIKAINQVSTNDLDFYNYLTTTLAHEMMHAKFDCDEKKKRFPYDMLTEEPLAEFGMLLFFYSHQDKWSKELYNWAYENVKAKKTCYSDGAKIMDKYVCSSDDLKEAIKELMFRYKAPLLGAAFGIDRNIFLAK